MLCRTVGAIAALSVGANAILLPPSVSEIADSFTDALGFAADPKTQAFKLPCPSCVFPSTQKESVEDDDGGEDLVWTQGGAKDVVFNFSVSEDDKAVMLNGVQLYPIDPYSIIEPTVGQVQASASLADIKDHPEQVTPLRVTSAAVEVNQEVIDQSANDKFVRINYQIGGLELQPMRLPNVELKLLENADGELMIISVEPTPKDMLSPAKGEIPPPPPTKECNMLPAILCKWKSAVESKIAGFKPGMPHAFGGCGGVKPHRLPGHVSGKPHGDRPHQPAQHDGERPHQPAQHDGERPHRLPSHIVGKPHGDRPHQPAQHDGERPHHPHHHHEAGRPQGMHHGGHHHHRHHSFLHSFVRAFVAVLIPVMAGITMGMFVSLIGMLVGRLIAFMWIKFRRGGQRGYASVAQADEETESMEKGVIVEEIEEEPLPKYEDAPAYNEKEQK